MQQHSMQIQLAQSLVSLSSRELRLKVQPEARKNAFLQISDTCVSVAIGAKPKQGAVNAEIERWFSELFPEYSWKIIHGMSSRNKVLSFL